MNGTIAQYIALATYGNAFLNSKQFPAAFATTNTTFQFCNTIDFRVVKKPVFFLKAKETVVAENPVEWYTILKKDGCKKLALYFQNSRDQSFAKDYKMAGMVGGGGNWFIETIYETYSDFWSSRWNVTKEGDEEQRIWEVNYGLSVSHVKTIDIHPDPVDIRTTLNSLLIDLADFAFKHDLEGWGKQFDQARANLTSNHPREHYYHKDLIPMNGYQLNAEQLLFSAGLSWVFGGMGSWNDNGFEDSDTNMKYENLTEELYMAVTDAILSSVNSQI